MRLVVGYTLVSICIALIDLMIACRIFFLGRKGSQTLAWTCVVAALVDISYLVSILSEDYTIVSVSSSLYFFSIDVALNLLAYFVWHYVRRKPSPFVRGLFIFCMVYMAFDLVNFAINPFKEIAFHCIYRDTPISHYAYQMLPRTQMHLLYCYGIIIFVLIILFRKAFEVPREYRWQYLLSAFSILGIVAINAVFLYLPGMGMLSLLDVSICGYSIAAFFHYQSFYGYTRKGMLTHLKTSVFENIDQGIVLFDYEDKMILFNSKATRFLSDVTLRESQPLSVFLQECGISLKTDSAAEGCSLQCYVPDVATETLHPLRCDYRVLVNAKKEQLGKLFVFADAKMQTDLLTGFHNWDDFRSFAVDNLEQQNHPAVVGVCDVTGLALINSTEGHDAGDCVLKDMADLLRSHFKQSSYYIRGKDANLIVLCYDMREAEVKAEFAAMRREFSQNIEYATSVIDDEQGKILDGIEQAEKALHNRKMMSKESIHYHALNSLLQALQECDSDTEAHVWRTQRLGENLAARLKLSSVQTSNLALLAVLHDIGKIGVPLEILNKPGKLTEEEWQAIKSHVEKGYQIAMSSPDFSGIADMIRHHHECWDGSGYPDGLSRESIPLLSRIIAVVDAYDAMVTNRSYRSAVTPDEALEELRRCAGTQFDPSIVSAFIQMLQENPELVHSTLAKAVRTQPNIPAENVSGELQGDPANGNVQVVHYSRYRLDEDMNIVSIDPAFTELTGYDETDIAGGRMAQIDLIPPEDQTLYLCTLNEQLAAHKMAYLEHRLLCKNGSKIFVFCIGRIYFDSIVRQYRSDIFIANSAATGAVRLFADQERSKAKARLEQWENTFRRDSLTGLLSHAAYSSDVELVLLNGQKRVMLLMIDLDNFKGYNDTHGHRAGDEFLVLLAQSISGALRAEDLCCRMGGDEFSAAVFFPTDCTAEFAKDRAKTIFGRVNTVLETAGYSSCISMGMALSGPEYDTFERLYEAADRALYEAKNKGKGCLAFAE